ncbi:MAG: amidase family protein [Acidimicrobiales bacterium]
MTDQLWTKSATELAGLIASKQVKSREVVDAHLDRIAEVNPRLNAITVEMAEAAQAGADAADATEASGPFHGVPFSIKENIDQIGYATTQAVAAFAEARPSVNAPTVQRMLDAGAIPIGRTNMPELGLRVSTDNSFRGLTRNPWASTTPPVVRAVVRVRP